ncbi:DUF4129 domain-containing protein [uncultured Bacteroides sp.]|uniref:DUF4129 domain-containing protein n=1 Tax=uncultured Bacteroides sp. TaxID=162156 RepID=UPI0023D5EA0A|nr:DUF4129 domain-containing protein [uncultured Bacteroides sp.]MDE6172861.1 DUF4129 domain-containing protein [Bacteroides sp.]
MTSSPADTLICDTAQLAMWQADAAYDYNRELIAPDINLLESFNRWFAKVMTKIFGNGFVAENSELILIGIAILLLVLIGWFVYRKHPGLFVYSRKDGLPYTVAEDTIYGVDFAGAIDAALSRGDYREAVRLLYLQTLKRLDEEGRIDWQPYKTPTQYIYEVKSPAFRQLTHHFLRVRYGNFEANETLFRTMRSLQDEVQKGGAS